MLALFKGELSYHEFMREMTYKDMMSLRDERVQQLLEEQEAMKKSDEERRRDAIRNTIMQK